MNASNFLKNPNRAEIETLPNKGPALAAILRKLHLRNLPCAFGGKFPKANWLIDSNGKKEDVLISDHHGPRGLEPGKGLSTAVSEVIEFLKRSPDQENEKLDLIELICRIRKNQGDQDGAWKLENIFDDLKTEKSKELRDKFKIIFKKIKNKILPGSAGNLDTDAILANFAAIYPKRALRHEELLREAAIFGDLNLKLEEKSANLSKIISGVILIFEEVEKKYITQKEKEIVTEEEMAIEKIKQKIKKLDSVHAYATKRKESLTELTKFIKGRKGRIKKRIKKIKENFVNKNKKSEDSSISPDCLSELNCALNKSLKTVNSKLDKKIEEEERKFEAGHAPEKRAYLKMKAKLEKRAKAEIKKIKEKSQEKKKRLKITRGKMQNIIGNALVQLVYPTILFLENNEKDKKTELNQLFEKGLKKINKAIENGSKKIKEMIQDGKMEIKEGNEGDKIVMFDIHKKVKINRREGNIPPNCFVDLAQKRNPQCVYLVTTITPNNNKLNGNTSKSVHISIASACKGDFEKYAFTEELFNELDKAEKEVVKEEIELLQEKTKKENKKKDRTRLKELEEKSKKSCFWKARNALLFNSSSSLPLEKILEILEKHLKKNEETN